jgi:Ca2+-binding EF-hand superfamily protein
MQLDVKLDMQGVREAKQNKQEMLSRLKQLDFDNSGTITIESLLAIASKFNMKISAQDAENIKKYYRKRSVPGQAIQSKVNYERVMDDILMSLDQEGKIIWVYAGPTN